MPHRFKADRLYVGIAHVRHGGITVQSALALHLQHAVLGQLPLIFIDVQTLDDVLIALDDVQRCPAREHSLPFGVILDHVRHGMQAAVHRAGLAEIVHLRRGFCACNGHGCLYEILDSLAA